MIQFTIRFHHLALLLIVLTSHVMAEVITSSAKMAELAAIEERWLETLRTRVPTGPIRAFVERRLKELHPLPEGQKVDTADHPNGAYLMLKAFLSTWDDIMKLQPALIQFNDQQRTLMPTTEDLKGALSAIIRLQRVFSLPTEEMYAGNYSGHVGPPLQPMDAYEVARRGFSDSEPQLSVSWLQLALRKGSSGVGPDISGMTSAGQMASTGMTTTEKASVLGLLGRAYLYAGETEKAAQIYGENKALVPASGDLQTLEQELAEAARQPKRAMEQPYMDNTTLMCNRDKNHTVAELRPYHKCRYKPSLWIPYITYKEEILSLSPYASLFYEVIYDNEMNALKEFVSGKLTRGQVELHDAEAKQHVSSTRTSDLGWITDSESPIAARLSARVEDITWLDTEQRLPAGPFSGEAFQVVNYGLGGHYVAHWDPVKHPLAIELKQSGTRIATFLYYLSDVEKGGNTAFVNAGISVAPVKGMALFWYNYNPAMDLEELTLHTGCPVLKGHKWIANKWIWTYGNTFRRPCGPSPKTTQLQLERIIYNSIHGKR